MPLPPHATHNVDAVVLTIGRHGHVSDVVSDGPRPRGVNAAGSVLLRTLLLRTRIPPAEATGTELADNDVIRLSCSSCEGRLQDLRR